MSRPIIRSPIRACTRPAIRPTDRVNGAVVQVGQAVYFSTGQIMECVFPGTLAGAEPTIIAPLGAPELVIDGNFLLGNQANWPDGKGSPIVTFPSGAIRVMGGTAFASVAQTITSITGASYLVVGTTSDVAVYANIIKSDDLTNYAVNRVDVVPTPGAADTYTKIITATSVTTRIHLVSGSSAAEGGTFDNISFIQVTKDGTAAWKTIG